MATITVSSYNVPRVLGNIYNTVSYYPGRTGPDSWYTPPTITAPKPITVVAGDFSVSGESEITDVMKLQPWQGGLKLKKDQITRHITVPSTDVTTTKVSGYHNPKGYTFTYYGIMGFTIGLGLPYVAGSHVHVCHVGDYVNWSIVPEALTYPALIGLKFNVVEGDLYPTGQNGVYTIGYVDGHTDTGLQAAHRESTTEDGTKSQLDITGWATSPGLYRITLQMQSENGGRIQTCPGWPVDGGQDVESFFLRILPKGPMPGDLCIVQFCEGALKPKSEQIFRVFAVDAAGVESRIKELFCYLNRDGHPINSAQFTYHDEVWAPEAADPELETEYEHAKGYWDFSVNIIPPTSKISRWKATFVLSHDKDYKWRMYMISPDWLDVREWVVIAEADTRTDDHNTALTPYYLEPSNDPTFATAFYAKGDQHCYVEGKGIFSTCGEYNGNTIYSLEPYYPGWPDTHYGKRPGYNDVLWLEDEGEEDERWLMCYAVDAPSTDVQEVDVSLIPNVSVKYCPPKGVHNHGDVFSRDITLQIPITPEDPEDEYEVNPDYQPDEEDEDAGDEAEENPPTAVSTSISNYTFVSQLDLDEANQSNDLTWTVKTENGKVAGYIWSDYYPLARMVNYLTTGLYVGGSGMHTYQHRYYFNEINTAQTGGTQFPTAPEAYYNSATNELITYTRSTDTENTLIDYTRSLNDWTWGDAMWYYAWTGDFGRFKLVGWNPAPDGTALNITLNTKQTRTNTGATAGAALVAGEWKLTKANLTYTSNGKIDFPVGRPQEQPCAIFHGGDRTLKTSRYWNVRRGSGGILIETGGSKYQTGEMETLDDVDWTGTQPSWLVTGGGGGGIVRSEDAEENVYQYGYTVNVRGQGTIDIEPDSELDFPLDYISVTNNYGSINALINYAHDDVQDIPYGPMCGTLTINANIKYSDGNEIWWTTLQASFSGPRPEYEITKDDHQDTLNTNPFVNWISYSCDSDGEITLMTGPAFPGSQGISWSNVPPNTDVSTLSVTIPTTSGGAFTAELTYSFGVRTSGGFLVASSVQTASGGRQALLAWQTDMRSMEDIYTFGGECTVNVKKVDGIQSSWFAANAQVMDGPWGDDSGAHLYMAPAGAGNMSLDGDDYYTATGEFITKHTESTFTLLSTTDTATGELVYYTSGATVINTTDTQPADPVTNHESYRFNCGFVLAGGVVELPTTADQDVPIYVGGSTVLTGHREDEFVNYQGNTYAWKEIAAAGSGGNTVTDNWATANFNKTADSATNGGLGAGSGANTYVTGNVTVNGVTTSVHTVGAAEAAVNAIQKPTAGGGWNANGSAYGETANYTLEFTSTSSKTDSWLTIGLVDPPIIPGDEEEDD